MCDKESCNISKFQVQTIVKKLHMLLERRLGGTFQNGTAGFAIKIRYANRRLEQKVMFLPDWCFQTNRLLFQIMISKKTVQTSAENFENKEEKIFKISQWKTNYKYPGLQKKTRKFGHTKVTITLDKENNSKDKKRIMSLRYHLELFTFIRNEANSLSWSSASVFLVFSWEKIIFLNTCNKAEFCWQHENIFAFSEPRIRFLSIVNGLKNCLLVTRKA